MEDLRGGSKSTGKWDEEEEATSTSSSFSKSKTSTTSSSSKSKARWADEDASSVCSDNYQSVHLALPVQQQQATKSKDLEEDDTESEDTLNLMKVHLNWFLASRLSLYSIYIYYFYDRKRKRRKPKLDQAVSWTGVHQNGKLWSQISGPG